MTIISAIGSAEETRAIVEAQEFRGYKYAKVTTLTVLRLCKWVINMGQQIETMRKRILELEEKLEAAA